MKAKSEAGEGAAESRAEDSAAPEAAPTEAAKPIASESKDGSKDGGKAGGPGGTDGPGPDGSGGPGGPGPNGSGGPGGPGGRSASAPPEKMGRKGLARLGLEGLCNGMLIMVMTQGLSRLYFEEPRATMVGLSIALICSIVMLLGVKTIARFIVFHRMIMRAGKSKERHPLRTEFFCRWLDEMVVHGLALFITLLLLTASRAFV